MIFPQLSTDSPSPSSPISIPAALTIPTAVQRGIDLAKAQNSDLFVFTGDLVNNAAWEIEPYLNRFGALKAPYGQFSILGNHDYGDYIQWAR